ncbi:hypothetical protein SOV_22440 [Sporomusa ovata DSM 2662]|uniref:hypothetical protein n=1 Tax=Sporomusa ovata TaxID=2378 RepID=UPI0003889576|nr:hypothetical protein [Sporomusa ovata]EQB25560.1 hypothetical protein SOV_4c02230 [Sporomusa ovata DSM 2662]
MRKSIIILLLIALLLTITGTASAEFYKLSLTRVDQDLYRDETSRYYFRTQLCLELALGEDAIYDSDRQQVTFMSSGSTYDVVGIFK